MTREQHKEHNAKYYPASVLTWLNEATDRAFKEFEDRTCESCKFYQPETIKGTLFKRCLFLGTVGDIRYCGRWEQK